MAGVSGGGGRVRVPDAGASVQELLEFARTYDGYDHFAAEPEQLQRLVGGVYDEIVSSSVVPEWESIPTITCTAGGTSADGHPARLCASSD